MYLLDTVTISELPKNNRNEGVISWLLSQRQTTLYISVISIGEIRRGICLQQKKDRLFALKLQQWLDSLVQLYNENILSATPEIALLWGELSAKVGNTDMDNLIAATALRYDLTVVTRNVRHFECTGAKYFNPWS